MVAAIFNHLNEKRLVLGVGFGKRCGQQRVL